MRVGALKLKLQLVCGDTYRSDKGWEIAVFARNLSDRDYIKNVTIQPGNSGLILATPSDPRTIGLTFRARQ